jgi:hypothetical protein
MNASEIASQPLKAALTKLFVRRNNTQGCIDLGME